MDKFKRVLPSNKFAILESLVRRLQSKEISRDEFDLHYFEIMLPYVTPTKLPPNLISASEIHIPPFKLSESAKKLFIQFFQIPREEKQTLLHNNKELIPVIRQFVVLQRNKHVEVTSGEHVLQVDGELEIPTQYNNTSEQSNVTTTFEIQSDNINEVEIVLDAQQKPSKKRKRQESDKHIDERDATTVQLKATIEQLQLQVLGLQTQEKQLRSVYVETNADALEKLKYEQLSEINTQLLKNLAILNEVMHNKHVEEENEKYGMSCILCFEKRRNVIFRPCSHVLQCEKCPVPKECPVCKKKVELANKIYL